MAIIGKLEPVEVREAWPGEASDFTPWLSLEENLSLLGEELGLGSLELVDTELGIGPYRLDILARPVGSDEVIVIENQFGKTDHSHLGQLMTYAAGVGTDGAGSKTVVWIAERFTEQHRAALDWLNQCTEPGVNFFGVELQLWRISDSPFAPKFNVVSRPNAWQKDLTNKAAGAIAASGLYSEYWANFIRFCEETGSKLKLPDTPPHRWWLPMYIGRHGFHVSLNARKKTNDLECQLWMTSEYAHVAFDLLELMSEEIVAALGPHTKFDRGENRCKIFETKELQVKDHTQWPQINEWLKERGEAYVNFFTPIVKALNLA